MGRQSKRREERRKAQQLSETTHQPVEVQQPPKTNPQPVQVQQLSETTHQPVEVTQPKPLPKRKRITFDVDPELHRKAFTHARRQGITIKDLLTNFLERETVNEKI